MITAVRAGNCPLPKINSRTSVDHVVRRSVAKENGRRRAKCANSVVRSSPTTAGRCGKSRCRGKRRRFDRLQRELVLTKVGTGIRSSSPEFSAVAFSAIDSARRKSGHPVVQRQRSMFARCQRTQDAAPRDGLSSLRRLHRRTLVITAVRAGNCPLPKINSRTSVDHVVRRSLPEESGRCREKLC